MPDRTSSLYTAVGQTDSSWKRRHERRRGPSDIHFTAPQFTLTAAADEVAPAEPVLDTA